VKVQQLAAEQQARPLATPTSFPPSRYSQLGFPDLEVDLYTNMDIGLMQGTPIISQDDEDNTNHPAANASQHRQIRTLTQDYMLHMMEIPGYTTPFSPWQAAS
jgi:hypothetical protein